MAVVLDDGRWVHNAPLLLKCSMCVVKRFFIYWEINVYVFSKWLGSYVVWLEIVMNLNILCRKADSQGFELRFLASGRAIDGSSVSRKSLSRKFILNNAWMKGAVLHVLDDICILAFLELSKVSIWSRGGYGSREELGLYPFCEEVGMYEEAFKEQCTVFLCTGQSDWWGRSLCWNLLNWNRRGLRELPGSIEFEKGVDTV